MSEPFGSHDDQSPNRPPSNLPSNLPSTRPAWTPQPVSRVSTAVTSTPDSIDKTIVPHRSRESASGLTSFYFTVATAALMFGIWFVGPRLVEEYHYAAESGKTRANYEFAVDKLEDDPLSKVSYAYQLVAHKIRPSVVSVNAIKSRFEGRGLGSGVVMSESGYIITNAHVLEGASEFYVEMHDRRRYEARLIGSDEISDLAVLKIDAPNLIPASIGSSMDAEVGSIVWAIGSPYGFEQTVTSGIISGKNRKGDPGDRYQKQSLIQTDAAVNPGNSGGPLVDDQGRVIGINTSIFGKTFQGISFAVPSETVAFVFNQIVRNGEVIRGFLGVQPIEVSHQDLIRYDLPDLNGAKIVAITANTPADRAGFRQSDIIRTWNGIEIEDYRSIYRLAEESPPNSIVEVRFLRNGIEQATQVQMGQFRLR
ncbi:MAG: trypsin-like peptidase domain-containing protein [Planctomycetota bacterium]